jgi:TolB-like protein
MTLQQDAERSRPADAVDRYLAAQSAGPDANPGETGISAADAAVFARCDAVIALIPKLKASDDLGWAFDEARQLARSAPRTFRTPKRPWYLNPIPAWVAAGALAVVLVVATIPDAPLPQVAVEPDPPEAEATIANITVAPIVVTSALVQSVADIEPVVLLGNEMVVDGRSLAILPFNPNSGADSFDAATRAADSIYQQVVRRLSAVPGLYVIDTATAAIYSDSELSHSEIARQLGVRGVVEGRVDAINGDIRFELQFTDAAANDSISRSIDRPTAEIALLQSDITESVLGALARPVPLPDTIL